MTDSTSKLTWEQVAYETCCYYDRLAKDLSVSHRIEAIEAIEEYMGIAKDPRTLAEGTKRGDYDKCTTPTE